MTKTKLGSIYDFQFGEGNTNPNNNGEYPIYGSNGIIWYYTKYNSEDTPVIWHIGANAGCIVFWYGKHFVTYNGIICKLKDNFDKRYAYFLLHTLKLQERAKGSAQPFLTYDLLENIEINVPDLNTQKKIGNILKNMNEQILRNEDMIQKLQVLTRAISYLFRNREIRYAA